MTDYSKYMDQAQEQAKQVGYSQFGKLTVEVLEFKAWVDDGTGGRTAKEVTPEEYETYKESDRFVVVKFSIDVKEFNPKLDWTYERDVDVLRGKKSDFSKTVQPSINKAFGKGKTLSQLSGVYVEARDVPKIKNTEYSTIEFVRVFKNRDEAFAAYNAKAGGGSAGTSSAAPAATGDYPTGYTKETWEEHMIPAIKKEEAAGKSAAAIAALYGVELQYVEAALA